MTRIGALRVGGRESIWEARYTLIRGRGRTSDEVSTIKIENRIVIMYTLVVPQYPYKDCGRHHFLTLERTATN